MAYRVRPESPADRAAVHRVNAAAFGQSDEADLVDALRDGGHAVLSYVAESAPAGAGSADDGAGEGADGVDRAGEVVGHVLLSRVDVGGAPALALAPLAVLPGHQRAGVGTALTEAALAAAATAGERLVVVLGHPEYYPRFGFTPASRHGVTGPYPVPDAVFQVLLLPAGRADDAAVPTGFVTYPPPFDPPS